MSTVVDSWKLGPGDLLVSVPWPTFHRRLTTQGYLCVSDCCCLAHQLGRSDLCQSGLVQDFGGCIHECQEKFREQPNTQSQLGLAKEYVVLSEVSSHGAFDRMLACREVGGKPYPHISFRVHLKRVHPLMKLDNDFRWRSTLVWIGCQM